MFANILSLIIDTASTLLAGVLLLRFWMQAVRVRLPLSLTHFMFKLSDWLVLPIRRILPGIGGYDWASLFGAVLVAMVSEAIELGILSVFSLEPWLVISLHSIIHWIVYGFIGLLFMEVIFSWVNPDAPLAPAVRALNQPLMRPLRRFIPPIAGVDISPIVAFLFLRVVLYIADSLLLGLY